MKRYFYVLAVLSLALFSCTKEIPNIDEDSEQVVFTVTVGLPQDEESKAILGEADEDGYRTITWEENDMIVVNGVSSKKLITTNISPDGTTATFEFTTTPKSVEGAYICCYPEYIWDSYNSCVNLQYTQDPNRQRGGDVARKMPMACKTTKLKDGKLDLRLKHLCSYLKIVEEGNDSGLKYVMMEGNNEEKLSGLFDVTFDDNGIPSLTPKEISSSSDYKTRVALNGSKSGILAVPAGEYSKGFTITVVCNKTAADGAYEYMKASTPKAKTFERAKVKPMSALTWDKVGDYFEITTADQWNAMAESFNGKKITNDKNLIISIENDLNFTDKTLTTVGDRSSYYFSGQLYGNGYEFQNAALTRPVLSATNTGSGIYDVVIASSCSYNPAFNDTEKDPNNGYELGTLIGYSSGGTVSNCINNAPVTLSRGQSDCITVVGGLIGRVRATELINCQNKGTIEVTSASTSTTDLYLGGVVGWCSSGDGAGELNTCINRASISFAGTALSAYIGGVAGYCNASLVNCVCNGSEAEGGISITANTTSNVIMGGVIGNVNHANVFKNTESVNRTTATVLKSEGASKYVICGGLYGRLGINCEITLQKTPFSTTPSAITVSNLASDTSTQTYIGGFIGYARYGATLKIAANCNMGRDITLDATKALTAEQVYAGGIIGVSSGKLTVESAGPVLSCSGKVTIKTASSVAFSPTLCAVGGIVGGALAGAELNNCQTTASYVAWSSDIKAPSQDNGKPAHVGGIAGYIVDGDSKINNCSCSSSVRGHMYNNHVWSATTFSGSNAGGILGAFGYKKDNASSIEITNCNYSGTAYAYRGTAAGIAGYLDKATVRNCSFTGTVERGAPSAGIAGVAKNSSFSGCSVISTNIKESSAGSCEGHTGGVAGISVGSSFDACTVNSTIVASNTKWNFGGIVGKADESSKIGATTACSLCGTVADTAVTSGNVGTLAVGSTTPATRNVNFLGSTSGKKVSIIGDSISTFDGYTNGYKAYYSSSTGDVNSVDKTYWSKYISMIGGTLEKNIACSGSCVCQAKDTYQKNTDGTFSDISTPTRKSFNTRYDETGIGSADVLILYGGTNDCNNAKGNYKDLDGMQASPKDGEIASLCSATTFNTDYFAPAYVKLLKKVLADHKGIKIILITGDGMTDAQCEWVNGIYQYFVKQGNTNLKLVSFHNEGNTDGTHYDNVNLPKYSGVHPNAQGMTNMANKIYCETISWL